jgi:hypothetical protein
MNRIWLKLGSLTAGCLLLAGCNAREAMRKSFQGAPFSTRVQLEEAIRLDQANSYMRAAEQYDAVLHTQLTLPQQESVQTAINTLYSRMTKAAARGEPEAVQTLKTIEASQKAKP